MNKLALILVLSIGILAVLAGIGIYTTLNARATEAHLNIIIGHVFNDSCAESGGIVQLPTVVAYLDEVDPNVPAAYMGCARDEDSGILILQRGRIVYYVPESE